MQILLVVAAVVNQIFTGQWGTTIVLLVPVSYTHLDVYKRQIIDSGIILIKYWLDVSMENQAKRFAERNEDPRKIWKLSPMDVEAQRRWYDYSRARDAMFRMTDTDESPWYVVDANDQRRARLNCIAHFLSLIPYEDCLLYTSRCV